MKLYKDIFTGTEIISDGFKFVPDYEGVVVKVKTSWVVKGEDNIDIGCGNAFGGPSEDQGGNANVEKVLDVIDIFKYEETSHDVASFTAYFKVYMKKLLTYIEGKDKQRAAVFKKGAQAYFTWIKQNIEDLSFYTPSDYDCDNSIIIGYYEKDASTPTFMYIIDGLKEEKI